MYLVFEFLDMDLKRYMDKVGDGDGMGPDIVKVSRTLLSTDYTTKFVELNSCRFDCRNSCVFLSLSESHP